MVLPAAVPLRGCGRVGCGGWSEAPPAGSPTSGMLGLMLGPQGCMSLRPVPLNTACCSGVGQGGLEPLCEDSGLFTSLTRSHAARAQGLAMRLGT